MAKILSYSFLVISNRLRRSEKSCKQYYDDREDFHTIPRNERERLSTSEVRASMVSAKEISERVGSFVASDGSSEKILASLKPWGYAGIQSLSTMIIKELSDKEPMNIPSGPAAYRANQERDRSIANVRDVRPWLNSDPKWFPLQSCKYFSNGSCHKGNDCTFLHEAPNNGAVPDERSRPEESISRKRSYEDVADRRREPSRERRRERDSRDRFSPRRRSPDRYERSRYEDRDRIRDRDRDRGRDWDRDRDWERDRRARDYRYDRSREPDRYRSYSRDDRTTPPLLLKPAVSASDSIKNGEPLLEKVQLAGAESRSAALSMLDRYLTLQSKQSPAKNNVHIYDYLLSIIERAPAPHRPRYLKFMNGYLELHGDPKTIMAELPDSKANLSNRYSAITSSVVIE